MILFAKFIRQLANDEDQRIIVDGGSKRKYMNAKELLQQVECGDIVQVDSHCVKNTLDHYVVLTKCERTLTVQV